MILDVDKELANMDLQLALLLDRVSRFSVEIRNIRDQIQILRKYRGLTEISNDG